MNLNNTQLVLTAGKASQLIYDGRIQIAFSGRSNVGKSSLINCLLNRKKLARVSSEPGKTITVNYYLVDKSFYFVDLPGYGYARRSLEDKKQWSSLVDKYITDDNKKIIIQLVDMKVGFTSDDLVMLDFMNQSGIEYFIVATKSDKLNKTNGSAALEKIKTDPAVREGTTVIPFSSLSGSGKAEIWQKITEILKS